MLNIRYDDSSSGLTRKLVYEIDGKKCGDVIDKLMEKHPKEIPEIKELAAGIAFQAILDTNKESRAVRRRMAENLNLSWRDYLEVEKQVLKITHDRENKEQAYNDEGEAE